MAKIKALILTAGILCGMIAVLMSLQGCRKAETLPPKADSNKQAAVTEDVKTETSKPGDKPSNTSAPEATKQAPPWRNPSPNPEAQTTSNAPPSADIDCRDAKYAGGERPKIEANGKPVTFLYYPPQMFTAIITRSGQDKASLTFGTFSVTGGEEDRLELHILARALKPDDGKFEKVAMIESNKVKKGQSWTASAVGMSFKVEALEFGEWADSPFPGSGMGWIKLRISAR